MPPATTMELFPVCTACAARATAFNPEPQTLLIVMAPVAGDNPPKIAACRAGFCPESGGEDVAHNAFVNLIGIEAGALNGFAHHDGTQLCSTQIGETSLKFALPLYDNRK
jgi:hypothetical protein